MSLRTTVPRQALKLYRISKDISHDARHYNYGGGHGMPLKTIKAHDGLDCSSSTALALKRAGLYPLEYAMVSGDFMHRWGAPGKGRYFTVWASPVHVWIQFHFGVFWRLDTSPWGDGGTGPRMRRLPRLTRGFQPRHWPGL